MTKTVAPLAEPTFSKTATRPPEECASCTLLRVAAAAGMIPKLKLMAAASSSR